MTPRQVEVFRAIMRAGSITGAAGRLNLSQPAVSKHLSLLEQELGFGLFERGHNRLVPTLEAEALFEQVEALYGGIEELDRFAQSLRHNNHGAVTVATLPLLSHRWMPSVLGGFAARHPDISLSVPVRSTSWIGRAVAAGRVDMGVGLRSAAQQGIEQHLLMRLPLVCVSLPDHPLAGSGPVDPAVLQPYDVITLSNFEGAPLALTPDLSDRVGRRRLEAFTVEFACEFARAGVGLAIVDALTAMHFAADGLVAMPLRADAEFALALMRPARRRPSQLASVIEAHLMDAAGATEATVRAFMAKLSAPPP
ncbi:LysR substrate-binding domain-containing protein [Acuticoccus sp. M5D2P5]|uniref:LysR substrate-binding domain-containing protein n=1 Tax=Acuticoccus kalidii TaxID=2910977 RepID=UPI001F3C5867|nr:LysR substrate-binding domain-containing protein [Acuticoccus kalidii]MCF3934953.1 LysR substrate-binding domain-containing protein [Acuticoccus kalidii]